MGRRKFNEGDRVIGNDNKASFRDRRGIVVKYVPHKGEYLVHFDDNRDEFVNTEWLDREGYPSS
jgi:hypothetical protein